MSCSATLISCHIAGWQWSLHDRSYRWNYALDSLDCDSNEDKRVENVLTEMNACVCVCVEKWLQIALSLLRSCSLGSSCLSLVRRYACECECKTETVCMLHMSSLNHKSVSSFQFKHNRKHYNPTILDYGVLHLLYFQADGDIWILSVIHLYII